MKIFISGGAGFIGSHLAELVLQHGHEVTVLDNLATGQRSNIDHLADSDRFRFVEGSILDQPLVQKLVDDADHVVHLAAAVGVRLIMKDPLDSLTTNVQGTENIIHACCNTGAPLFVASSSEVYGKNSAGPLTEQSDRIMGPTTTRRWSYALSKAYDEVATLLQGHRAGLHTTVGRFFNTVGPRQSPAYGMVVPRLAYQAIRNEPITVYGDGQQTRCFCHVSDTVRAVAALLDTNRPSGEVFNIGRPDEISILDLASKIRDAAESESLILTVPYSEAFGEGFEDMRRRVPDISRIQATAGWCPQIGLDQIISDAITTARVDQAAATVPTLL